MSRVEITILWDIRSSRQNYRLPIYLTIFTAEFIQQNKFLVVCVFFGFKIREKWGEWMKIPPSRIIIDNEHRLLGNNVVWPFKIIGTHFS